MTSQGVQTYSDLKDLVAAYAQRSDLTTQIPGFLKIAQNRVAVDLRAKDFAEKNTATADGTEYLTLPTGWQDVKRLVVTNSAGDEMPLREVGSREIYDYDTSYDPVVYAVIGSKCIIRGTPANGDSITVFSHVLATELTGDTDTSSFLTAHYEILLYAALAELYRYTKAYDEASTADQSYTALVDRLIAATARDRPTPSVRGSFNLGNWTAPGAF